MSLRRRVLLAGLAISAMAPSLAACKVLSIEEDGAATAGAFNATAYAEGLWAEKVLPYFTSNAHPLPEVLAAVAADLDAAGGSFGYRPATEGSPWTFIVTGTGTVTGKNTKSRAGTLTVSVDGANPPAEIAVQIGPVVRGNAVRDALPFVSFKGFTNQLEYADVGKALTALALAAVTGDSEAISEGQKVTFLGAMNLNTKTDKIVVTAVSLKVQG